MAQNFWFKFEWAKWLGDRELGRCTFETKGFWIQSIALMEEADTWFLEGTIEQIANLLGCSDRIAKRCVEDLETNNAAKISRSKVKKNGKNQDFVKVESRRLLKKHNLREYNKLKKREERENKAVKKKSNESSKELEFKSLKVLETKNSFNEESFVFQSEQQKEKFSPPPAPIETDRLDPHDASTFGYSVEQFVDAFPDVRVTLIQAGLIASAAIDKPIHRQAWANTIGKYIGNRDPVKGRYDPSRIGTVLDVFKSELAKLENSNGSPKNGTRQTASERNIERLDETARLAHEIGSGQHDESVAAIFASLDVNHPQNSTSRQLTAGDSRGDPETSGDLD